MTDAMTERARQLRKVKGPAERKLWRELRGLNRQGFHFRQQVPIGLYIADFADHERRLVIEVDGSHHGLPDQQQSDDARTTWLQSQGYRVIRFWNGQVADNIDGVMSEILLAIGLLTEPAFNTSPPPLVGEAGRGEPTPQPSKTGIVQTNDQTQPNSSQGSPTPNPSPQGGGGFDLTSPPPLWGRPGGGETTSTTSTRTFSHVDTWIFDLDNTLYPASCDLFAQVDHRMGEFIAKTLGVPYAHARHLQKAYYRQFGTTLSGLMQVHKLKPEPFLEYVHDIDLSVLPELPELATEIEKLPGRRLIFTNGSRRHAENVAAKIGVLHLFEDICDIAALEFVPKPERSAFERMAKLHGISATTSAMFEDMPHNLEVPHDLGMATVLVHSDYVDHPVQVKMRSWTALPEHIHHMTKDLTGFLSGMVNAERGQD